MPKKSKGKVVEVATIIYNEDGTADAIYTDAFDLRKLGKLKIKRASHVEPDKKGLWWADMSPVGGPKLGPFVKRTKALAEEVKWLKKHVLR